MTSYIRHKKDRRSGANKIVSYFYRYFKDCCFLDCQHYGSLTLVTDNCGGQNKNQTVLHFLMWLVEVEFFPMMKFVFLIKGYTKNAYNHMFNLINLDYHCQDSWSFKQVMKHIKKNKHITVNPMEQKNFYNFEKILNK